MEISTQRELPKGEVHDMEVLRDICKVLAERIVTELTQKPGQHIGELYQKFQEEGWDERAIRTAFWDTLEDREVRVSGGNRLFAIEAP